MPSSWASLPECWSPSQYDNLIACLVNLFRLLDDVKNNQRKDSYNLCPVNGVVHWTLFFPSIDVAHFWRVNFCGMQLNRTWVLAWNNLQIVSTPSKLAREWEWGLSPAFMCKILIFDPAVNYSLLIIMFFFVFTLIHHLRVFNHFSQVPLFFTQIWCIPEKKTAKWLVQSCKPYFANGRYIQTSVFLFFFVVLFFCIKRNLTCYFSIKQNFKSW